MITAQIENLTENLESLKELFPDHYEELALNKDSVPLDPQYDTYLARDELGEVIFASLRDSGEIVGYFVGFIAPGLHYKTCLTCTMDIFFVHPDHRGKSGGIKLFRCVEKELKRRGVQRWFVGSKCHKDASILFEKLGFSPVEVYYSKMLGD